MRRDEFNASMEQAEQLITAAGAVGTAASPILLFYGIAQIGRAVSAASVRLSNSEYQSSGHGLRVGEMDGLASRGLASLLVQGETRGAHAVASRALGACALNDEVSLGTLWHLLQLDEVPLELGGAKILQPLELRVVGSWATIHADSRWPVIDALTLMEPEELRSDPILGVNAEFDVEYPLLVSLRTSADISHRSSFSGELLSTRARIQVALDSGNTFKSVVERLAVESRGLQLIYPTLDSTGLPTHPYLIWWEVLYALSRLARYKPREWVHLTDVARHVDAAPIEAALKRITDNAADVALGAITRAVTETTED